MDEMYPGNTVAQPTIFSRTSTKCDWIELLCCSESSGHLYFRTVSPHAEVFVQPPCLSVSAYFNPYTEVAIWLSVGHLWFYCDQERGFAFIYVNERPPSQIYSSHVSHLHICTTIQINNCIHQGLIKSNSKCFILLQKYTSIKCSTSKESWKKASWFKPINIKLFLTLIIRNVS